MVDESWSNLCTANLLLFNFFLSFRLRYWEWFLLSGVFSPANTMSSPFKPSPGRRHGGDLESGRIENADSDSDTFSIPAKNASVERLQQWRVRPSPYLASSSKHYTQRFLVCECESAFKKINSDFSQKAALVLNASRRFRYTLDLKKEQEAQEMRKKIRTHAHALLVSLLLYHGLCVTFILFFLLFN